MKNTIDRAFMMLCVLLGLAVCLYARSLGVLGPAGPDSGFFPMITGVLITLSGALLLVTRSAPVDGDDAFFDRGAGSGFRVLWVVSAVLVMILLIPHLGFLLTGATITPLLLRAIDARPWPFCIAVGAIGATAIVLLFSKVLNVPLPVSPLGI
jgi:hypothetical protein